MGNPRYSLGCNKVPAMIEQKIGGWTGDFQRTTRLFRPHSRCIISFQNLMSKHQLSPSMNDSYNSVFSSVTDVHGIKNWKDRSSSFCQRGWLPLQRYSKNHPLHGKTAQWLHDFSNGEASDALSLTAESMVWRAVQEATGFNALEHTKIQMPMTPLTRFDHANKLSRES